MNIDLQLVKFLVSTKFSHFINSFYPSQQNPPLIFPNKPPFEHILQTKMLPTPPAKPPSTTTVNTTPPLPQPALFDLLPALYEILSRIDPPDDHAPLDPKDLPAAILPLKAQMRRALREVAALPDVDRGVAEQEAEIAELEILLRKQEEALKELGEVSVEFLERDVVGGE